MAIAERARVQVEAPAHRPGIKLLLGTVAYNPHVQNMARALYEHDALFLYAAGGVDVFRGPVRAARRQLGAFNSRLDVELKRRAVTEVPNELVRARWRWELPRTIASRLHLDERLVDWLWERSEFDFDRACSRLLEQQGAAGFLGVEYGALASLRAAKRLAKPATLAYLSPHHSTYDRWVGREYEHFPELVTHTRQYFDAQAARRRDRRDEEASLADWIVTNSGFTTRSLIDAGFNAAKILTVPLGGPVPVPSTALPTAKPSVPKFTYVGPVSVRKGAHYLLEAWNKSRPAGELHFYGEQLLPRRIWNEAIAGPAGTTIVFHGSVPRTELTAAYLEASVLVLPTLCDGFGMVVSEALAHGLPVITTRNAGAADAVTHQRTGFILPPADSDALASAMTWCVEHADELFEMRPRALEAARAWTWTDFRQRFADVLLTAVTS